MILNMHRIPPVGADDTGGPFGSEYTRRAEVVAPYIEAVSRKSPLFTP